MTQPLQPQPTGSERSRGVRVVDLLDEIQSRDRRRIRQSLTRLMDLGLVGRDYAPSNARETYRYRLTDDSVVFVTGLGLDRLASLIEGRDPTVDWVTED